MKKTWWMQTAALGLSLLAPTGAFAGSEANFALALADVKGVVINEAAARQPDADNLVIRDRTTTVSVDLNDQTVKCSAADYSAPMLKVLVPALAGLTILNHRNTAEGAPCLAAGQCKGNVGPRQILKLGAAVEQIPVRVVLKKELALDGAVCRVSLVETVTTKIRGVAFFHERREDVAERVAADCR